MTRRHSRVLNNQDEINKNVVAKDDTATINHLKYEKKKEQIGLKHDLLDKLDSYNEDSAYFNLEQKVLGSLFYANYDENSQSQVIEARQYLGDDGVFNDKLNSAIYDIIMQEYDNNIMNNKIVNKQQTNVINIALIDAKLKNFSLNNDDNLITDLYNERGGLKYLSDLIHLENSIYNISDYAQELYKCYQKRNLIKSVIDFASDIKMDNVKDLENNFSDLSNKMNDIVEAKDKDGLLDIAKESEKWMSHLEDLANGEIEQAGLSLGNFKKLNAITSGLRGGQMITLGARPAVGKTAYALNLIRQVLKYGKTPDGHKPVVAMFSLEMDKEALLERYASLVTSIPAQKIRTGSNLTDDNLRELMLFVQEDTSNFYINDRPDTTILEMQNQLNKIKQQNNGHLDLVVIDYLQLMNTGTGYGSFSDNRVQQVSKISRDIKIMAKALDVPILCLAQLSRGLEQRQDKRPVMSDIRESGSIEQDSDIIMFLYRDDYYEDSNDKKKKNNNDPMNENKPDNSDNPDFNEVSATDLIIAKNRAGKRGTIKYTFDKAFSRFDEEEVQ